MAKVWDKKDPRAEILVRMPPGLADAVKRVAKREKRKQNEVMVRALEIGVAVFHWLPEHQAEMDAVPADETERFEDVITRLLSDALGYPKKRP